MWKCSHCNFENSDSSNNCISCSERKGSRPLKTSTSYFAPKASSPIPTAPSTLLKVPTQNEKTCYQAIVLENWGSNIYILSWIFGIVALISSGFINDVNPYAESTIKFSFGHMLLGILPLIYWIVGGFVFKIIAESFAIIVESAYRNLKPKQNN